VIEIMRQSVLPGYIMGGTPMPRQLLTELGMIANQYLVYAYALGLSFLVALGLTEAVRRFALRRNIVDHPGARKIHVAPIPLLGGVAVVITFYGFLLIHVCALLVMERYSLGWLEENLRLSLGEGHRTKLAGIAGGGLLIFALGLWDDVRRLSPWAKLAGQLVAAGLLVWCGISIKLFFVDSPWLPGPIAAWLSAAVTITWIVFMTNSLNLLDNMDGLCGGVSVIAACSFFLAVQSHETEQEFVRLLLVVFAGAMGGFLYHNLNPARIFMGDAGALFSGFMLATVAVVGTFHVETTSSRIAVTAPLVALSVPLFDTFSVMYLRWRGGQSIMLGDKRHFSHRLVDLGMTTRQAVEFILLVAAVVGLGGALLPTTTMSGTLIILGQTIGVFLLIVLLMNAGKNRGGNRQ